MGVDGGQEEWPLTSIFLEPVALLEIVPIAVVKGNLALFIADASHCARKVHLVLEGRRERLIKELDT